MNQLQAFYKKEWIENIRTAKLLIFLLVAVGMGIISPLLAKLLPLILLNYLPEVEGIILPEANALQAFEQFYKNMGQIGLLVFVLLNYATLTNEIQKQTLILPVTKGLKRSTIVLAKGSYLVSNWTLGYWLSYSIMLSYTAYYWKLHEVHAVFIGACIFWLFGVFISICLLSANVCMPSTMSPFLFLFVMFILLMILQFFPAIRPYVPLQLASQSMVLHSGESQVLPWKALSTTFLLSLTLMGVMSRVIKKRSLVN